MPISKQQPMREAEIELVDAFNQYMEDMNNVIRQYTSELQTEIEAREALERRVTILEGQINA